MLLRGFLSSIDGSRQIRDRVEGPAEEASKLADELLQRFWKAGAAELLAGG